MEAIKVKAHVGHNGILQLEIPVGMADVDCEITVTLQPKISYEAWIAFIEETAGSLSDDPIERLPQGKQEVRDEIL